MQTFKGASMAILYFDKYGYDHFNNWSRVYGGCGDRGRRHCDYYNNFGHTRDTYYKLQGYLNYDGGAKTYISSTSHIVNNESSLGLSIVP